MIGIPLDPTNLGRALLLLKKTLEPGKGLAGHQRQPVQLAFIKIEGAQLPHLLDDPRAIIAFISIIYINQTGLMQTKHGIFS